MPKIIGIVISAPEAPSTFKFNFVINNDSGNFLVRKGQFVQLETEEGTVIGRVDEIFKTNRYFMQAEAVREYEKVGKPLTEVFPVDRWEYLVARATPLGIYNNGMNMRVAYPPSPGSSVEIADDKILSDFLGLRQTGLNIGKIAFHNLDAKLDVTKLFKKHLAILAMSGAGKSHLCSVFLEELLDRSDDMGKPAIILIDPHGEYKKFATDDKYGKMTRVFNRKFLSIAGSSLTPYQIDEFVPEMSGVQKRELIKIMKGMKRKTYDLEDLIGEIENAEMPKSTRETLVSWLSNLQFSGLFGKINKPTLDELAKPGQLSILDVSDFIRLTDKQIIVAYFARQLFNARRSGRVPPFIFIVEEAHQFCPESTKRQAAISRSVIQTIAREGRKFFASLVLISQRPVHLSTTALSQCNTHVILRVTNPYDLDQIKQSSESITSDVVNMISGLRVGEALVVGEALNQPVLINVRYRKSKVSDKGESLEDAIREYVGKAKAQDKDMETFM